MYASLHITFLHRFIEAVSMTMICQVFI